MSYFPQNWPKPWEESNTKRHLGTNQVSQLQELSTQTMTPLIPNIELEVVRLNKHFGAHLARNLPVNELSAYISSLLHDQHKEGGVPLDTIARRIQIIRSYQATLDELLQKPQVVQRSQEWFDLRKNRLTASDIASALNRGKFSTRSQLLIKKAFPDSSPFVTNSALTWGVMFEPMASRCYAQRNNDVRIHEFGLIPHPDLECFGASPDGITDTGIMLEFKCPFRRKIDGSIPEQYELQMQGQMAVCGLHECDYVECDMHKFSNRDEYEQFIPAHETRDHGIILEHLSPQVTDDKYLYSPEYMTPSQTGEWLSQKLTEIQNCRVVFWRLRKINIVRVFFDEARWLEIVPLVVQFWKEVEQLRTQPEESVVPKPKKKKVVMDFIDDEDDLDGTA
jgi:putative phage-type endonuclease